MNRLTVRQILALILVVPIVCAVIGLLQLYPHVAERQTASRITAKMVVLGDTAAELIHILQIERGSSVGLLSATENRATHRNRVVAAQEAADKALETFNATLTQFKDDRELPARAQSFVAASASIAEDIKAFRERILTGAAEPPDVIAFYSGVINSLIHGAAGNNISGRAEEMAMLRSAYQALMFAKEFAGLQRATGNGILSADEINPAMLERFIRVSANQNEAVGRMRRYLGDLAATYVDNRMTPAMQDQLAKAERQIITYANKGGEKPLTSNQWWSETTARIDAMRASEKALSERLGVLSAEDGSAAFSQLLTTLGLQIAAVIAGISFMAWIGALISGPIRRASDALERSMRGDADVRPPPPMSDRSEIGRISNAVGRFIEAAAERQQLIEQRTAAEARLGESRRDTLIQMEREFNAASQSATGTLQAAAVTLNEKSVAMLNTVNAVRAAQDEAFSATEGSRETMNEVSRLSDELSRSIAEIAEQTSRSAQLAQEVLTRAETSRESAGKFEEVANAIGSIVDLINAIASQTNLLALNATIEAARAGAAGKGFAVVAGEVKELASRTMGATRTIEAKVVELKDIARQASEQSSALSKDVNNIQGLNSAIAAAVHEQHMTSEGFGQSIRDLSEAVRRVAEQVDAIARLGSDAHVSAASVQGVADEMERTTGTLVETLPRIIAETGRRIMV
jgi:methyl-accepting chemotaxis protein